MAGKNSHAAADACGKRGRFGAHGRGRRLPTSAKSATLGAVLLGLDHVNLRTDDVGRMQAFYVDVLGLHVGPRPAFSFGGAWLYCGDSPVVHLVKVDRRREPSDDIRLEHFAFRARGLSEFLERLKTHGIASSIGYLRDFRVCQVNVRDPDGTHVHVDFDMGEAEALGLVPA
jgi:catechol 2,3-dioxygenase-like lactoylglutathione lyase family enzyme